MKEDVKNNPGNRRRIWAIGSGKGGVGKSLVATNLAIVLANLGRNVIAIDLDLGNANMHTCLGIKYPPKTLMDFFNGKVGNLNEITIDTPIFNLKFISGSGGIIGSANLWHAQKIKLMRYLENLYVDDIVLDLGAGTSYNTVDFFLAATNHVVLSTPDTTSIQSSYNFIRICIFRKLYQLFHTNNQVWRIVEKVKAPTPNGGIVKFQDILREIEQFKPPGFDEFMMFKQNFHPLLIMNMVMKNTETRLGWGIREVVKRYLDTDITFVGNVSFDNTVRDSMVDETPHIINAPRARASADFMALIPSLMGDSSDGDFLKDTATRELRRASKTYDQRIVEPESMDVDPSIYAVDKIKTVESPEQPSSMSFFRIKPTSWSKIAIDLGTSNTMIYVKGRGIVINEPSLMSVEEHTGKIVALGHEAKAMTGRAHSGIKIISPLESGAISDYSEVKKMVQELIKFAKRSTILIRPGVLLTIQPGLTSVEKRAFMEFIRELGARELHLVYAPLAAAIGAGLPVDVPKANMLVNVGGGTTSAIIISLSGIVSMVSDRVGGKTIDSYIQRYIRDNHNFSIGEQMAEWIKINFGQAMKIGRGKRFMIRGLDVAQGIPQTLLVSTAEISEAIAKPVHRMLKVVLDLLEEVPPELSGDLVDRGMNLTGGGAYLQGFDKLISEHTGIKVHIPPKAQEATIEGAGRMLNDFTQFSRFFVDDFKLTTP